MVNIGDILKTINELKPRMWVLVITFTLSTIVCGSLAVMVINPKCFWAVGTSKVVLLAICLTLPVWAINSLLTWTLVRLESESLKVQNALSGGGIFTTIIFLIPVIMAATGCIKDLEYFLFFLSLFESIFILILIWFNNGSNILSARIRRSWLHFVLIILNIISCLFIFQIVFGLLPLIPCTLEQEKVDMINGFVVDMSVGIITSTFFYYLLVYLPEKRRKKQVRLLNQDKINHLCGLMQVVVGYFCDRFQIDSHGDLLDADFNNIPLIQNFGEKPISFWFTMEVVSDYSGSTEIGFLHYYLRKVKVHASSLYAANELILDDLELLSVITRIKGSKLISNVELLSDNRGMGIIIPALSQQIREFIDLYKSFASYAEIHEITLKGEKPENVIPIICK